MGCCSSKPEAVVVPENTPVTHAAPPKAAEAKPPPAPPAPAAPAPVIALKPPPASLYSGDIQHVVETAQHARNDLGHGLAGEVLADKLVNQPPATLSTTLLYGSTWRAMQEPKDLARHIQEDPDVADASQLMTSGVSLAWLQELACHPEHGALTPAQLQQQVAAPATQQTKSRYLNVVGSAAQTNGSHGSSAYTSSQSSSQSSSQPSGLHSSSLPAYWIWLEQSWHHSLAQLMSIVGSHIQTMEPGHDPKTLAVWLECVCCHAHTSPTTLEGVRATAREWLSSSSYAKPTLVCLQRVQPKPPDIGFSMGGAPEGDAAELPGSVDTDNALVGRAGLGSNVCASDRNNLAGSVAGSLQQPVSHLPVMTLWRSMNGLHGFHKAWFDTVNMVYLD